MSKTENKSPLANSDPISQYYELINNINSLRFNIAYLAEKLGEQVPIQNIPCEFSKFLTNMVCSITDKVNDGTINKFISIYNPEVYKMFKEQTQQLDQYSNNLTNKLNALKNNVATSVNGTQNAINTTVTQSTDAVNKQINSVVKPINSAAKQITQDVNALSKSKKVVTNTKQITQDVNALSKSKKVVTDTKQITQNKQQDSKNKGNIGGSYNKIINPETGRTVNIYTKKGKEILNKYKKNN